MNTAIPFPRADPVALAAFDERSKECTMNCGPHSQDPRSPKERRFLCEDCQTVPVPPPSAIQAITSALWDYHHALDTRQHGGLAQDKLVHAVEKALGKPWVQGATRNAAKAETTPLSPWQPIATAPQDGTKVLMLLKDSDVQHLGYFNARHGWCIAWDQHILSEADGPTHWMPLADA